VPMRASGIMVSSWWLFVEIDWKYISPCKYGLPCVQQSETTDTT
jgi:hypothetical protein